MSSDGQAWFAAQRSRASGFRLLEVLVLVFEPPAGQYIELSILTVRADMITAGYRHLELREVLSSKMAREIRRAQDQSICCLQQ